MKFSPAVGDEPRGKTKKTICFHGEQSVLKAAAFIALAACSPSVASVPSSLPAVKIDRSLQGPVCSREAAEVIAVLRARERGDLTDKILVAEGQADAAWAMAHEANKRAAANAWWGTWGGLVAVFSAVVFGAAGAVSGFYIGGAHGIR